MNDHNRKTVLDAIYVLNDIFDSLVASTMVLNRYQRQHELGQFSQPGIVAVQKMCVSQLVLGLSKLVEFWKYYNQLVPADLRSEWKSIRSKLETRHLQSYRNTVVAHIMDKKLGRPPTQFEAIEQLNCLSGGSPNDFLKWINNPDGMGYSNSVVSVVATTRDRLREKYNASSEDVFDR